MKKLYRLWVPMLISALLIWPIFESFYSASLPSITEFANSERGLRWRVLLALFGVLTSLFVLQSIATKVSFLMPTRPPSVRRTYTQLAADSIVFGCMVSIFCIFVSQFVIGVIILPSPLFAEVYRVSYYFCPLFTSLAYIATIVLILRYPNEKLHYTQRSIDEVEHWFKKR